MDATSALPTPTFSVVIPLFQKRHRISDCLASVKAQTLPAFEVIVIDDGSTDGGDSVVREVGAGWVQCVSQSNQGVSVARNTGIALARGAYIALLDGDDTWRPDHLATLASLAKKYPASAILGTGWTERGTPFVDAALELEDQEVSLEFFLKRGAMGRHLFATPAVAVRRTSIVKSDLFPVGSRIAEDQDAWITLLEIGNGARSRQVTVDVYDDPISPTMNIPRPQDFESVIFKKWSESVPFKSRAFGRFVSAHRLFTIQRHVGIAPTYFLFAQLRQTQNAFLSIRGLGVLLRMFLHSVGLLQFMKTLIRRSRS